MQDKFDLMRFDASGAVSAGMFDEDWPRFVVKMATGAGKTKVLSLAHRLELLPQALRAGFARSPATSSLIAPNIIVLDRLRPDFDGLRIFFDDPVLPDNGYEGRNWRDDFQLTLHMQDDVRVVRDTGNIFLTNIHRVYLGDVPEPSLDDDDLSDYFLGLRPKPVGKTTDSKVDLGVIVRDIDELVVLNDEAHHIHDPRMAWFKSIQDIHHRLLQKDGRSVASGRRDRDAPAQQRRDLRADRLRLPAGRGDPPERRQAPGAAGRRQPRAGCSEHRAPTSPRSTPTTWSSASRNGGRATTSTRAWARRRSCS